MKGLFKRFFAFILTASLLIPYDGSPDLSGGELLPLQNSNICQTQKPGTPPPPPLPVPIPIESE